MASLFFSYSHKDEALRDQLETHLALFKRQGLIEAWHDRRIAPGAHVHAEISEHLEAADVVLLLVSPEFLASDYCYDAELARAMERHQEGTATVIPVILRPCAWRDAPFSQLRATPKDGRPITLWPNIDEAFLDVTAAIRTVLKQRSPAPMAPVMQPAPGSVRIVPAVRSSNLRIAKSFTERESAQFLHDAFEYIAKFFELSLEELQQRNPGVEGTFRRIDANRFTAVAYQNGRAAARCGVFLGGLIHSSGGIAYSANDSAPTNSFDEMLSVNADEQTMFLRPLGMIRFGRGAEQEKLSMQGAAELFWGLFMEPLQRIDVVHPGTAVLPVNPPPSALLSARHRVSPFHGREEMLEALRAWCAEVEPVRARLLYADAGTGKTRLAIELCERLRSDGWVAGFLRDPEPPRWFERLWASGRPVLVVVDPAESRAGLAGLLELVARNSVGWNRSRFRALLLARNAGDWWAHLTRRDGPLADLLVEQSATALPPLVPSDSERGELVRSAAAVFAQVLGRSMPSRPLPQLVDVQFDRVLYLQMAALAWVEGVSFTAETLIDDLLEREERFWIEQARARGDKLEEGAFLEDARRALTGLMLSGGASSEARARGLLHAVNGAAEERLLKLLGDLYPGWGEGPLGPVFLGGLEPDLLGEGMVWRTLCFSRGRGDSVESFLDRVFEGGDERALATGFGVLGCLSEAHPIEVRSWIAHMLRRDLPERALVALEAAKAIGARTAHAFLGMELAAALEREGTSELAERLKGAGIPDETVSLREVGAWVAKALLSKHSSEAESVEMLARRAGLLNELGVRQSELGQREAALLSAKEAVEIRRALAKARPDAFLPDLAASLTNLGLELSKMERSNEALEVTREASEIQRALAKRNADAFLPSLAGSLHSLAFHLHTLGRAAEALSFANEALDILWPFYERFPKVYGENAGRLLRLTADLLKALNQPPDKQWNQRMTRYLALSGS